MADFQAEKQVVRDFHAALDGSDPAEIPRVISGWSSAEFLWRGFHPFGLIEGASANLGAIQVLWDLVIVCLLACFWMVADARRRGRNAWPFVAITLFAGSFGPLLYILVGEFAGATDDAPLGATS